MKNLFKFNIFAVLVGLGLIFSHGASANYTYSVDESSFNVVQNSNFLHFIIPADKALIDGESFEATINVTLTTPREFNSYFQVAQTSSFSASSSSSSSNAEIISEKLYEITNDNSLSLLEGVKTFV